MRANEKCSHHKSHCSARPPCPPPCPPCPDSWEEFCKDCHKYCCMKHCKPPCWDHDRRKDEQDQAPWQSIDPPQSSCGSCWAFSQSAAGDMRQEGAAGYGQEAAYDYGRKEARMRQEGAAGYGKEAAYDYGREEARNMPKEQSYDPHQETGMIAPQKAPEQRGYPANWAYTQDGIWVYYPKSLWSA